MSNAVPTLGSVVLDCADAKELAGFYARLFDAPAPEGDAAWASVSVNGLSLSFQQVGAYSAPTWPTGDRPQQLHLDLTVDDLPAAHDRAVDLGAKVLDDSHEGFRVYADPAGHPFCLCA